MSEEPDELKEATDNSTPEDTAHRKSRKKGSTIRLGKVLAADEIRAEEEKRKKLEVKRVQKWRARNKEREEEQTRVFDFPRPSPPEDTKLILQNERGIRDLHVLSVILELGEIAASNLKIVPNKHFWLVGPANAGKSIAANAPVHVDEVPDDIVPGELVYRRDLYALYQFSVEYRHPEVSFEDFLRTRRMSKTDVFRFGKELLGKDFHEIHQKWADFFPKFNPDVLKPGYSQEEMKAALQQVSECKSRLLIASRNAYKSSFVLVWLVTAILFCPDLRALLVSETKPLSKGFARSLRSYFEILNPNEPTFFQQYFPEHAIPNGEGSELTFESPAAHLRLIQSTVEATSMESTGIAGTRADVIIFDDPISDETVRTQESIDKSIHKHDLILKILEVGSLGSIVVMTPWHEKDLGATLLQRNDANPDHPLQYRIDPAWKPLPHAVNIPLLELTEQDVSLLFPERLSFKFLRSELLKDPKNTRFFQMQNLCEFLPLEDASLKINFSEDALMAAVRPMPPGGTIYVSCDTASSDSKYADLSALVAIKVYGNAQGQPSMHVVKVVADRFRSSELAMQIVMLTREVRPATVLIEKIASWDLLQGAIDHESHRQGTACHVFWKPITNTKGAKFERIKALETLLAQGRLTFEYGDWIEEMFRQFTNIDGKKRSSSTIKDDIADAISLAYYFVPNSLPDFEQAKREEEAQMVRMRTEAHRRWIFGSEDVFQPQVQEEEAPYPLRGIPTRKR
jgi:hypothetical protein